MANVRFDNITFRYGTNTVLENFSLEVESGKIVCLVGPSGCGKTTLVRALLGLIKPETGSITVATGCCLTRRSASTSRPKSGISVSCSRTTPCGRT